MISSTIPKSYKSCDVIFITSAAFSASPAFFHKIDAKPSGESIEYTAFLNINILLATDSANAPPEPPSPITTAITGTVSIDIFSSEDAIASNCPRSSAPTPGYAPGVSINVITGLLNFSA